jgi:uncharacterized protein
MPTEPDFPQSVPQGDPLRPREETAPALWADFSGPLDEGSVDQSSVDQSSVDQGSVDQGSGPRVAQYPRPVFKLSAKARQIPNIGDTLIFLIVGAAALILTEFAAFAVATEMHLFGHETTVQLLRDPRLLIPTMAISYLIAGAVAWVIFSAVWNKSFVLGVHWASGIVRRRFYAFLGVGILLSVITQLLSNFLPIPRALPIDDFFRTRVDIWMVAVFGTFVAPLFEELAFRGFLFPSLASAWDWLAHKSARPDNAAAGIADPGWSLGALIFSATITSIGFALLHADQLAHSWAPLLVLFAVSVVLCLVRLKAHSLAASTLVHATYNGTIFVLMFFATDGFRHLDKIS